jgi:hypothetical protein
LFRTTGLLLVTEVGLARPARTGTSTPPPFCGRKAIPISKPPVDRLDVIGGGDRKFLLCALRLTVNSATPVCRNSLADQRRYPRAILIRAPAIITYESFQLCHDVPRTESRCTMLPVAASLCVCLRTMSFSSVFICPQEISPERTEVPSVTRHDRYLERAAIEHGGHQAGEAGSVSVMEESHKQSGLPIAHHDA